jgi:hypothetical protein
MFHAALVSFGPPPKEEEGHSLLSGPASGDKASAEKVSSTGKVPDPLHFQDDEHETPEHDAPWIAYVKPNITISMVNEFSKQHPSRIPPHMAKVLEVSSEHDRYNPIIHISDFWLLRVRFLATYCILLAFVVRVR